MAWVGRRMDRAWQLGDAASAIGRQKEGREEPPHSGHSVRSLHSTKGGCAELG